MCVCVCVCFVYVYVFFTFQTNDPSKIMTGAEETLRSHLLTFAAEQARKEDRVINLEKEPLYK